MYGGGLSTQFNTVSVDMDALSSGVCLNAKALPVANDVFISAVQPDSPDAADVDETEDSNFFANPYEDISSHAYLATENGVKHYVVHKALSSIDNKTPPTYIQVVSCEAVTEDGSLTPYNGLSVYSFDRYADYEEVVNVVSVSSLVNPNPDFHFRLNSLDTDGMYIGDPYLLTISSCNQLSGWCLWDFETKGIYHISCENYFKVYDYSNNDDV